MKALFGQAYVQTQPQGFAVRKGPVWNPLGALFIQAYVQTKPQGHRSGAHSHPEGPPWDPNGPPCNSGNRGSLEQFASISALRKLWDGDPAELATLAEHGDAEALAVWSRYGATLGVGISSLVYLFTPELVLLGGGISGAASHFLPSLRQEIQQRVQAVSREGLRIEACALGNGAGCLGAARLAIDRLT